MLRTSVVALALSAGVILSGSALAESAKFDGTWSVSLVANGGLCGSGTSSTLMVRTAACGPGAPGRACQVRLGRAGPLAWLCRRVGFRAPRPASCQVHPVQGPGRCPRSAARAGG
jgi:hypothetical protein